MMSQAKEFVAQVSTVIGDGKHINDWGGNPWYHFTCYWDPPCPYVPVDAMADLNVMKNRMDSIVPHIGAIQYCCQKAQEGKGYCEQSMLYDNLNYTIDGLKSLCPIVDHFNSAMHHANPDALLLAEVNDDCGTLKGMYQKLHSSVQDKLGGCRTWAQAGLAIATVTFVLLGLLALGGDGCQVAPIEPDNYHAYGDDEERARRGGEHGPGTCMILAATAHRLGISKRHQPVLLGVLAVAFAVGSCTWRVSTHVHDPCRNRSQAWYLQTASARPPRRLGGGLCRGILHVAGEHGARRILAEPARLDQGA